MKSERTKDLSQFIVLNANKDFIFMIKINSNIDISEQMRSIIESGLKEELERCFEDAKKEALDRFESTKGQLVAGFLVRMMNRVDFRTIGDTITFSIENRNVPEK